MGVGTQLAARAHQESLSFVGWVRWKLGREFHPPPQARIRCRGDIIQQGRVGQQLRLQVITVSRIQPCSQRTSMSVCTYVCIVCNVCMYVCT